MKLKAFLTPVALTAVLLSSCSQDGAKEAEKPLLSQQSDTISYALGYDMGHNFLKSLTDDSVAINLDAVHKGIEDGLKAITDSATGQVTGTLLTAEQMKAAMQTLQTQMQEKQAAKQKAQKEKYETRKKTAKADGEKFRTENQKKAGVKVEKSGLQYRVIKEGSGKLPNPNDMIKFNVVAKFIDGEVFQSTLEGGQTPEAPLNQLGMPGMIEAFSKMPVGSKWEVVLPPNLAYGEQETGVVPPNSTIVMELELLDAMPQSNNPHPTQPGQPK
jgi:FKBP-type peptidyl-prolyl cis-trans isomerase